MIEKAVLYAVEQKEGFLTTCLWVRPELIVPKILPNIPFRIS